MNQQRLLNRIAYLQKIHDFRAQPIVQPIVEILPVNSTILRVIEPIVEIPIIEPIIEEEQSEAEDDGMTDINEEELLQRDEEAKLLMEKLLRKKQRTKK